MDPRKASLAIPYIVISAVILGYTGRDDSHITYHAADQIASGLGITNYSGDSVEQSSTLLFTFLLALAGKISAQIAAFWGPILSTAFIFATYFASRRLAAAHNLNGAAAALACTLAPVLYWSFSGTEVSLYIFLLVLLAGSLVPSLSDGSRWGLLSTVVVSFLITLVRPESPFVLVFIGALLGSCMFLVHRRMLLFPLASMGSGILLALLFQLAIGLNVFPNPVQAKMGTDFGSRIASGVEYFLRTAKDVPGTALIAFAFFIAASYLIFSGRARGTAAHLSLICVCISLTIGLFSFAVGGDWMENGRFLVPAIFFAIFGLLVLIEGPTRKYLTILLVLVSVGDIAWISRRAEGGLPLWAPYIVSLKNFAPAPFEKYNVVHSRDLLFVDRLIEELNKDGRENLTIVSYQGGAVPYYLFSNIDKKLEFVDLAGLTSKNPKECSQRNTQGYMNVSALFACLEITPDYVFDVDRPGWPHLLALKTYGCTEIYRGNITVDTTRWKADYRAQPYIVRCTKVQAISEEN